MKKLIVLAALPLMLAACAGRPAAPVSVVQPMDSSLDCPAIQAEVTANDAKISQLGREEGGKVAQNVLAIGVGMFFWPVLFAADFQGSASKDTAALQQRQSYLATLAVQKSCGK